MGQEKAPSINQVEAFKTYFAGEGDKKTFDWVQNLRSEVEPLEKWIEVKNKAREELKNVPADIIPQILQRFHKYLDLLPAGHSKGHAYRDFITSMLLLRDPALTKIDDVEKFVGILGGTFHDIGNSVVRRYDDNKRFASHAEVGAYFFGELAKDILPPHLLKLTEFAIAAHTNYPKEMVVARKIGDKEVSVTKIPYQDALVERNKAGIWLTRMADRLDLQGAPIIARHCIVKAEPTEDFDRSTMSFHVTKEDKADFVHQFTPVLRSKEFRDGLSPADKTQNILEHFKMLRDSNTQISEYSKYDSEFFRDKLVRPAALEGAEFSEAVLAQTPVLEEQEMNGIFEKFYKIAQILEPGADIKQVIEFFREKFSYLTPEQRSHWANGFKILPKLYSQWFHRINERIHEDPILKGDQNLNQIFLNADKLARQKLQEFDPQKIQT